MTAFLWVIISYLLGSLPFGYIISRISGKDVLRIGWRKTSGSNVFKNVGKWQGILTGLLDVVKGCIAVWGAQKIGLTTEVQVLSGVAAVTGHNWSIFLRFAGGRGIGTFAGALLAISPLSLAWALIPLVLFALVWSAAVGTILALVVIILLPFYFEGFQTASAFTLVALLPIFIKRLSPIIELINAPNKAVLLKNRLVFDNDEIPNFRIKRIFTLTAPLWLPSKLGWKAARYGAKIAQKGVKKYILKEPEVVITALTVEDFKRMMIAASKKIVLHQEEINKINVFPVADRDTGYNMAATLLGVEGVISRKRYSDFRELTEDIKQASMVNARGNAGMICTGYFFEVVDRIKHLETVDAFHFALALKRGIKAARDSIAEPVEGTILDVTKAAGQKAYEMVKIKKEKNIVRVLEEAHKVSQTALKETKEKLDVLKKNDVVDAGALGFVKILEAWIENLKGIEIEARTETAADIQPQTEEKLKYRYEVVSTFKKNGDIDLKKMKEELSLLGDSLEIIELDGQIKFHIHTGQPEAVKEKFRNFPGAEFRIEDMQGGLKEGERKTVGLVVDGIADLPKEFIEKHDIIEVPFTTRFPDTGEIIHSKEEIYPKMKEAVEKNRSLPTTSAPTFKEFLTAYQKAFKRFKNILVITVSSKLSGAYSSARIARSTYKKPEKLDIYVFDCFTGEVAEGLVNIKAQELISQGKEMKEVVEELKEFCPKVNLLASIDDFKYVAHGGRVKVPKFLINPLGFIQKIGIRPLIGLKNGKVQFYGISFGKNIAKILAEQVDILRNGKPIRAAVGHADCLEKAEELKRELEKLTGAEVQFVSLVSPVVGTHTGPGALLVAFHTVDSKI
jgi:hypothetical protein